MGFYAEFENLRILGLKVFRFGGWQKKQNARSGLPAPLAF
jgi:hypothetical protein